MAKLYTNENVPLPVAKELRRLGHLGINVCTTDGDFIALAARIDEAVHGTPSLVGKLMRVNRPH